MFSRVVEFAPTSDAASQFVQIVQEMALRIVKGQAGCVAAFVQVRGRVVMGVSVWKSISDAERYSRECYPDIEKMLRPFLECDPKLYTFGAQGMGSLNVRARAMVRNDSHGQAVVGPTHPANDDRVYSARSSVSHR